MTILILNRRKAYKEAFIYIYICFYNLYDDYSLSETIDDICRYINFIYTTCTAKCILKLCKEIGK
jgi:hypothetical protein